MSWVDRLPGTNSETRARNVAVGIGYLVAIPVVVAVLPLLIVGAVALNVRDAAARLSGLPGIGSEGGLKAGLIAGVYAFGIWGLVLTAGAMTADVGIGPGADDPESDPAPNESDATGSFNDETDAAEPANETESLPTQEIVTLFQTILDRSGVELVSVEPTDDVFRVAYVATGATEAELTEEMGYVTGAYVDSVSYGLETDRMEVTALSPDTDSAAFYWHVESEWAEEYNAGEATEEAVFDRVLETFEPAEDAETNNETSSDSEGAN